jgi:hypothetical protein
MRAAILLTILSASAIAADLGDDATLSRRLVGTWHGGRHDTRYFSDGTWMMDPQNYELLGGQNTHGNWRIKNGQLIETWRFKGESTDSSTVAEIIELTATRFRFRTLSQDGPGRPERLVLPSGIYTETRISDAALPSEK